MIIQFPDSLAIAKQSWGQKRNEIAFASAFGSQAQEALAPLWQTTISPPTDRDEFVGEFQALILRLKGRQNLLALHNLGRPQPRGTMRGAMALSGGAAQGASSLTICASGQGGKTLVAGDYLGIGTGVTQQVVMVTDSATANGSGAITVSIEPPLRNAFASGSVVTWDKPKALFRRSESESNWDYEDVRVGGMSLSLVEDWRV
ncbi:MAG: hypothetical protein H6R01_937 [Burkholderiaceae bacterium]|nr:hypothetical protein [Burkholderiaceae bacterium]